MPTIKNSRDNAIAGDQKSNNYLFPLILITTIFFMWAVAHNLNDILTKQFKKSFELNDFKLSLIQSAFYFGYFFLAIPAARVMKKYGYKAGILLGLLLYAFGAFMFYPAAEVKVYGLFLSALFIIACGLAFLETASNPYMTVLGSPETATRRLNLAQAFNALGAISGVLIGKYFIFSGVEYSSEQMARLSPNQVQAYLDAETRAVQTPYLIIGCIILLWAVLVFFVKLPEVKEKEEETISLSQSIKNLLKYSHFKFGVLALFFYVGAQVGVWSFQIRYIQFLIPGTSELVAADYLTISLIFFITGRFGGTFLMKYIKPATLMAFFAGINVFLVGISIFAGGYVSLCSMILVSLFMSIMFPTIFALSISGLGSDTKMGSSFLIMSIVGGAVLTAIMGLISDSTSIRFAFFIPLIGFAYILWFSARRRGAEIKS